jgi:hypothetical protein
LVPVCPASWGDTVFLHQPWSSTGIRSHIDGEKRLYIDNDCLDNLREVVDSNLPWGLILYGEEEEKFLEASTDTVLSAIWKVGIHEYFTHYL